MTRVYADMVADLFHAGHVEFLRRARALGDELIVGVHNDDDCEWYKRRPILTMAERMTVVGACRHVDKVVGDAPLIVNEEWLKCHDIDLVVHGDDWSHEELEIWYPAPSKLGILELVPYTHGISSRDIEERVLRARPRTVRTVTFPQKVRGFVLARSRMLQRREAKRGLRKLHDALVGTPIDGRYWVICGVLLGWARDGRLLPGDLRDVDLAYLDADHERFLDSVGSLVDAGFRTVERRSNSHACYSVHKLQRRGILYEFFRHDEVDGRWRTSWFDGSTELVSEMTAQPLVPFELLGRSWLKAADHEAQLVELYGDWRTPHPDWDYRDDPSIVARIPIPSVPRSWEWPDAVAYGPGERKRDKGPPDRSS